MSLEPRILAKIDNRLRSELRKRKSSLTARVPVSEMQWAIWKRYCEMVGVSAGGGLAVLVDHELASVVEEDVETLTQTVKSREAPVAAREVDLAKREEAVEKRVRFCDFQGRQRVPSLLRSPSHCRGHCYQPGRASGGDQTLPRSPSIMVTMDIYGHLFTSARKRFRSCVSKL